MGVIVATIIMAVISKLIGDEIKAWAPTLSAKLVGHAVRSLSPHDRVRFAEEWQSHIDETPGDMAKLCSACGFVWASTRMEQDRQVSISRRVTRLERRVAVNGVIARFAKMVFWASLASLLLSLATAASGAAGIGPGSIFAGKMLATSLAGFSITRAAVATVLRQAGTVTTEIAAIRAAIQEALRADDTPVKGNESASPVE